MEKDEDITQSDGIVIKSHKDAIIEEHDISGNDDLDRLYKANLQRATTKKIFKFHGASVNNPWPCSTIYVY